VFREREGVNLRNHGHCMLPVEGTSGMWKARLEPGWQFILGEADDPNSPALRYTRLEAGETIPARERGDWYAAQVITGSADIAGKRLVRDDVVLAERGAQLPELVAGKDGVEILESFRTIRAF
jgi:redox-sensitive bicupin YhaK (pirin superfamily)